MSSVRAAAQQGARSVHGPGRRGDSRRSPEARQVDRMELPPMSPRAKEVLHDEVVLPSGSGSHSPSKKSMRRGREQRRRAHLGPESPVSLGRVVEFPPVARSLSRTLSGSLARLRASVRAPAALSPSER